MLAVYEAINITLNPPQTLIKNLLGHDFGALKATKCPHNKPHITHNAGIKKDGIVIIMICKYTALRKRWIFLSSTLEMIYFFQFPDH